MRFAKVIGVVTLSRAHPDLVPGALRVVRTANRNTLAGADEGNDETLVLYDDLGARDGDWVGLVEGREATSPFYPAKTPVDAYNACILEQINFQPILPVGKGGQAKK